MAKIIIPTEYQVPEPAVAKIAEDFLEYLDERYGGAFHKLEDPHDEFVPSYEELGKQFAKAMETRSY